MVETRGVTVELTSAQESAGRLSAMLDSISDGFFLLDREFRFVLVNRKGQEILDSTMAESLGRTLWEAYPAAAGSRFEEIYRRVMRERVGERFEEFYPDRLNTWVEVRLEPAAEGILIYFQNVTERRTRHEERERLLETERISRQEAERAQEQVAYQATHDSLTGLVNRGEFARMARATINDAHAASDAGDASDAPVIVLFMDVDRFKLVNDSLGHAVGDALLVKIGERLSARCGSATCWPGRGGDEFVVLLRDADVALYRAKDSGGNQVAWFDGEGHQRLLERIALESDLRDAVADAEIVLNYQPSFAADDSALRGVEALARWTHPEQGAVSPEVFVPLAEECGLSIVWDVNCLSSPFVRPMSGALCPTSPSG